MRKVTQVQQEALDALKAMPTANLVRGMAAFSHPPRCQSTPYDGDASGCFVYAAYRVHFADARDGVTLSYAYECLNDWFKGECLRELAERGAAPEPTARAAEMAQC